MSYSCFIQSICPSSVSQTGENAHGCFNLFTPSHPWSIHKVINRILASSGTIDIIQRIWTCIIISTHTKFKLLWSFFTASNRLVLINSICQPPLIPFIKGQLKTYASFGGLYFALSKSSFGKFHNTIIYKNRGYRNA